MNTFDKVILFVQGAAVALTGTAVIGSLPKWLAITAIALNGACLAATVRGSTVTAASLKSLRAAAAPTAPPST